MDTGDVVVVSGSYGAGHDAAADALARDLRTTGRVVRRLDVVDELPWGTGRLLRWAYFTQLRLAPASWASTLRGLEGEGWTARAVRVLLDALGRGLVREVAGADLVVSTHPFASQALGTARAAGRLSAPVVTYLTDASVHGLWVHPAVDLHLAIHDLAAAQATRLGGRARVVRPVVPERAPVPGWAAPWPEGRPAALVVGGSCGVGELRDSALDLLATGLVTPVVACGTNERLRQQLDDVPGVVALGWRDDMRELVAAAACVVQNAGGMTSLESLASGTPTLTYRPLPGHGTSNADALSVAGLVPWVLDPADLGPALQTVLERTDPPAAAPAGDDLVDVLAEAGLLTGLAAPAVAA